MFEAVATILDIQPEVYTIELKIKVSQQIVVHYRIIQGLLNFYTSILLFSLVLVPERKQEYCTLKQPQELLQLLFVQVFQTEKDPKTVMQILHVKQLFSSWFINCLLCSCETSPAPSSGIPGIGRSPSCWSKSRGGTSRWVIKEWSTSIQEMPVGIGVVQTGKQKAQEQPNYSLPVPKGAQKENGDGLFIKVLTGQGGMVST